MEPFNTVKVKTYQTNENIAMDPKSSLSNSKITNAFNNHAKNQHADTKIHTSKSSFKNPLLCVSNFPRCLAASRSSKVKATIPCSQTTLFTKKERKKNGKIK